MLRDCAAQVEELLSILDAQLHALIQDLVSMPASIFFSPDNLDGQYISPRLFEQYLQASYTQSNEILSKAAKSLVVHVGGPMRQLVEPLAQCGVDAVEGVSGHPQSDVEIPQARKLAGREITLWGGIPQDWLLENTEYDDFEQGVRVIFNQAAEDGNTIVGVADRVPAAAELDRLKLLARWLAESS